jgi:hypothetical protein
VCVCNWFYRYDSFREQKEFQAIHAALIENFSERMQLKKSIIEIDDTNSLDRIEVDKKLEDIKRLDIKSLR